MQIYEVRISHAARLDMAELRAFLDTMLSEEGAIRYANNMRDEIKMLAIYADLYGRTTSMTLRRFIQKPAELYHITAAGFMYIT